MVCLGNICRSPLAEGILKQKALQAGLHWTIESAGTTGHCIGIQPHALSQQVARAHGIDISAQQCRQFVKTDMRDFDHIYVMDEDNYREVQRISGELWDPSKVSLLMDEVHPGAHQEIPDPWYGPERGYHEVFDMIERACEKIVEREA
ncbi:MAG: low molecular weight phosphotyrosine protein phosphatase [Chitinophagaceae bacterium]|nr:low molecular weight phosphotyrosine protein phosphatase [Chitinophagaceae bacterium]